MPTEPNSSIFSLTVSLMASTPGASSLRGSKPLPCWSLPSSMYLRYSGGESQLALGVHVDLGDAQGDGLLDHLGGDAGAAVKHQGHGAGLLLDLGQHFKVQALSSLRGTCRGCCRCRRPAWSTPRSAIILHSSGSATSPPPITPSSSPPMAPTSASTEMPFSLADADQLLGLLDVLLNADSGSRRT